MKQQIIKILIFPMLLCAWLFAASSFAAGTPLPSDQAFALSVAFNGRDQVSVAWRIAPGYYLYAKKVHITLTPDAASDIRLPQGDMQYDKNRGGYEAFSGNLSVPVFLKTKDQTLQMGIDYQGCSQDGFCYPPMHQTVMLNVADQSVTNSDNTILQTKSDSSFQSLLSDQNGVQSLLQTKHFSVLLIIFAGLGLLLAFTPCVLPMIPILTSIIVGQKQSTDTKKAFMLSLCYVIGSAITYAIAGLIAASMGNSLQAWLQKPWIIGVTSGLFVLLSLSLFGLYDLKLPNAWQNRIMRLSNQQQGGNYLGVFMMGMLSTLIVSPCVTAPLVGVLMYISQTGDRVLGASALFVMGLGMGVPLILIGMSAGKWLPKSGAWMEAVKKSFGIIMLGMAIWLISRVASQTVMMMLWGALLLGIAIFIGFSLPRLIGRQRLNRSLGFLVGCSGMLLMVSGLGLQNPMDDWLSRHSAKVSPTYTIVRNVSDLNEQLAMAKAAHKPVILDFYADWCASCVTMDHKVFSQMSVQRVLANYVFLRADLTENTAADEAIMKQFNVIAPPTVIFFNTEGQELNTHRIVGEVDAEEFLTRINHMGNQIALKSNADSAAKQ